MFGGQIHDYPGSGDCEVLDLALGLQAGIPHGPSHSPYLYSMVKLHGQVDYPDGTGVVTDLFSMGCHVGTHFDALGHVSCNGLLHDCVEAAGIQSFDKGLARHGAEELHPIVARGVLLDAPGYMGLSILPPEQGVGPDEIEAICLRAGVSIGAGDAVLLRTGWVRHWPDHAAFHARPCPGLTLDGAKWLADREVAVIGADNYALEIVPAPGLPVHVELLVRRGIPIIEMLDLEELAARGQAVFTFIAAPLKIVGGSGAPTRPLALVRRQCPK